MNRVGQNANHRGSALLCVLVAVTIMGLVAGITGSTWKTITQRANEEELLWRGNQYIKAIGAYYNTGLHATLPHTLEQLVRDPRIAGTVRHLRKLYLDPMTREDWVLIKDSNGRVQGVRSSSELEPFKKDGFSAENQDFAGKTSYADWRFVYTPKKTLQAQLPANKNELPHSGAVPSKKGN